MTKVIDKAVLQQLRDHTGLGLMDCRKALEETGGDFQQALDLLRKKGAAVAAKRADKETGEGLIKAYIHPGDRLGVLIEINCETDFVANTEAVRQFAQDLCLQIAASKAMFVGPESVDPVLLEREREIFRAQMADSGKPEKIIEQVIEGKIKKLYTDVCLLEQSFIKNDQFTVRQVLQDLIAKTGESIRIKRFCRFELGEKFIKERIMAEIILIENDIKSFQKPMEAAMENPIKHFERELVKIRTGRAHTSMIEDIPVVCYGQDAVPLKGLGVVSAPDPRLLTVQPWDVSIISDIEKAVAASGFGVTPVNDGKIIRFRLPEMSSERRDELVKMLHKKLEECKMAIRNVRKDFKNLITDAKKDKKISENFHNRLADVLQKITDEYIDKVDDMTKKKEVELASV